MPGLKNPGISLSGLSGAFTVDKMCTIPLTVPSLVALIGRNCNPYRIQSFLQGTGEMDRKVQPAGI